MKKNIFLSLMLIILATFYVFPQNNFIVLGKKGDVRVYNQNSKNWTNVKSGDQLNKNNKVQLGENAFVAFYHKSGKHIDIKGAGKYNLSNLVSNEKESEKLVFLNDFWSYLLGRFSNHNAILLNQPHQSNMSTLGGPERDVTGSSLKINFPKNTCFINPVCGFSWFKVNGISDYEFHIKDKSDREVFTKFVSDTSVNVDISKLGLTKEENYLWYFKALGNPVLVSEPGTFLLMSDVNISKIKDSLNILLNSIGDSKSASAKIILAYFYEKNMLHTEANDLYMEAIKMAPDVEDYKLLYNTFLTNYQINGK